MYNLAKFEINQKNDFLFKSLKIEEDTIKIDVELSFITNKGINVRVNSIFVGEGSIETDDDDIPVPCGRDLYVHYAREDWDWGKHGLLSSDDVFNSQLYQFLGNFGIEHILLGEVGAHDDGILFYETLGDHDASENKDPWDAN
jgi:hypothetical protein